jgi:hypothetical protein
MFKSKESAFTRNRKLVAKRRRMILLHRVDMLLQLTIDKFFITWFFGFSNDSMQSFNCSMECSNWWLLIGDVLEEGFSFVMRVRHRWNPATDAAKSLGKIIVTHDSHTPC